MRSHPSLCDARTSHCICLRIMHSLKRTAVLLRSSTSLRVRRDYKVLRAIAFEHFFFVRAHMWVYTSQGHRVGPARMFGVDA